MVTVARLFALLPPTPSPMYLGKFYMIGGNLEYRNVFDYSGDVIELIASMFLWLEKNFLTVIQLLGTIILGYLAYKLNKAKMKIEKFVEITEKIGLAITWMGKPNYYGNEIVKLSNCGISPIDEIEAIFDITISSNGSPDISLNFEWERKTVLDAKEDVLIFLSEKLFAIYEEKKLMRKNEFERPTSSTDGYGEYIMEVDFVKHLTKPFTVVVNIEVKSKIYETSRTIRKNFQIKYNFKPEYYDEQPSNFQYDDNYDISISQLTGNWKT